MNVRLKYFLMVANELNISRAAKKLYISQQCLSRHIKKLESEFDTILFYRKPKLTLTAAGEKMVQTLQQMQMMELSLATELKQLDGGYTGKIKITMPQSRFKILTAPILQQFHKKYPNVIIELHGYTTLASEELLLNGQIDMFIGINPTPRSQFEIIPLGEEALFVIGTPEMFRRYIADFDKRREDLRQGIRLNELQGIPIISIHNRSIIGQQLEQFVLRQQVELKTILIGNDAELHIVLANRGYALSFCAQMHLALIKNNILFGGVPSKLIAFPIKDYHVVNTIALVYYKETWKPRYVKDFISQIVQHCKTVPLLSEL